MFLNLVSFPQGSVFWRILRSGEIANTGPSPIMIFRDMTPPTGMYVGAQATIKGSGDVLRDGREFTRSRRFRCPEDLKGCRPG